MKNIIYSILVCLPFVFGACDKSTDDTSKVTYFVTLEREGDEKIVLEKGQPFVEPGYYAEMNGEDITESVQIKGSVDVNTPGIYNLVYAAYNEDGFAKTFTRTVYVADNTASPLKIRKFIKIFRLLRAKRRKGKSLSLRILQSAKNARKRCISRGIDGICIHLLTVHAADRD